MIITNKQILGRSALFCQLLCCWQNRKGDGLIVRVVMIDTFLFRAFGDCLAKGYLFY